jgi:hypothetical protein
MLRTVKKVLRQEERSADGSQLPMSRGPCRAIAQGSMESNTPAPIS